MNNIDRDALAREIERGWTDAPAILPHWVTKWAEVAAETAERHLSAVPVESETMVCAWCPASARGEAWHNDGRLHPSCGQPDHGHGWVPTSTLPVEGEVVTVEEVRVHWRHGVNAGKTIGRSHEGIIADLRQRTMGEVGTERVERRTRTTHTTAWEEVAP